MGNLKISLDSQLVRAALLSSGLGRLENPTPLYRAWALYLERIAVQAYRKETAPFGAKWKPLAASTRLTKKRRTILRETLALFNSTVGVATSDGAQVGSNQQAEGRSLLAAHQFGEPRRRLPARPVLPLDERGEPLPQLLPELTAIALDYVLDR